MKIYSVFDEEFKEEFEMDLDYEFMDEIDN